ncbi:ATP-binding cassette, sub-B (MDR TAP), member 4 [Mortierella claussenii]|nr:ATP-binding cassette, sub-B (MDR TAP), member 4 [Mortierella claussenii]
MHDLIGLILRMIFSTAAIIALGMIFAFHASWRLTLITLICFPMTILQNYFAIAMLTGFRHKTQRVYEYSAHVAAEAIRNIRTVAALAKEIEFEAEYRAATSKPHKYAYQKIFYRSIDIAMSQSLGYWYHSFDFVAAAHLERKGLVTCDATFQAMFFTSYLSQGLDELSQYLPKYVKGKQSANNVLELLGKKTIIDANKDGIRISKVEGSSVLENVDFHYPTHPDIKTFKGVNLQVQPPQTVALEAELLLTITTSKDLQLNHLREHMAIVGQESVLLDTTIGENIHYGIPGGQAIDQTQAVEAVKAGNIRNFVMSLPNSYDTHVGGKGSQLSGRQKQRVAITSALIRNPCILLLDDATSALDSESEKLYGTVVESGRHSELTAVGGMYSELYRKQDLEGTQ